MQFVDEDADLTLGRLDLGQHRLQTLLELAAILGSGNQGAEVEPHEPLVAE